MKTLALAALAALLLAGLPGCSFWANWEQHVLVIPSEPAAEVYVDGQRVGAGMLDLSLSTGDPHEIRAELGGRVAIETLGTKLSIAGSWDTILGFLLIIPWAGLMTPGASEFDRAFVLLTLPPAAPPSTEAPASAKTP